MKTAREIIASFGGTAKFADATGQKTGTVRLWLHRDAIPAQHYPAIVLAARRRRVPGISLEVLHSMAKTL